ncbi:MAG: hypothetical protein HKP61_08450 [Dactylosporangium sp.]|nr:hypothetical protein [Dactylosporangium sp.]NNJ60967.1 hypothetical protein [Dactylosporangium sp.]
MTSPEPLTTGLIKQIMAYLDRQAPPPTASAHLIFGTNQPVPAELVVHRYHQGLVPLVIATGGMNRHTSVIEAREHQRILIGLGVPESVIHVEDRSTAGPSNCCAPSSPTPQASMP